LTLVVIEFQQHIRRHLFIQQLINVSGLGNVELIDDACNIRRIKSAKSPLQLYRIAIVNRALESFEYFRSEFELNATEPCKSTQISFRVGYGLAFNASRRRTRRAGGWGCADITESAAASS